MQFSNHGRYRVASVDGVVRTVTKRVEGIRRLLNSHPTEESLHQYHQDALTLSVRFERLRSVLYLTRYQRTLTLVMSLFDTEVEIEPTINLRNVADRNSSGSRNNKNNNNTLNTTNLLPPNTVTDNISITSTAKSGISPIREENERQNLDEAPCVAQVAKAPRFKIDRKKLEQLLSVGFLVRKIAGMSYLGEKPIIIQFIISWQGITCILFDRSFQHYRMIN